MASFGPHTYLGYASTPSLPTDGYEVPAGASACEWSIEGSGTTTGTYWYYRAGRWVAGKTFNTATDGRIIVQSCFGQRVAIEASGGTVTSVVAMFHQGQM